MSCNLRTKSDNLLRKHGAITGTRFLGDNAVFEDINNLLTNLAYVEYGVGNNVDKLFNIERKQIPNIRGGYRNALIVVPNNKLFDILEDAVNSKSDIINDIFNKDIIDLNDLLDVNEPNMFTGIIGKTISKDEYNKILEEDEVRRNSTIPTGTPNEFILFGNKNGKSYMSVKEVLDNIFNYYEGEGNEYLKSILRKTRELTSLTNSEVIIMNEEDFNQRYKSASGRSAFMIYDPNSNKIVIVLNKINSTTSKRVVKSMLHEVVHSITYAAYHNPATLQQEELRDFILDSFTKYKELSKNKDLYGFTNADEFMAEAYSNIEFAREIHKLDQDNKGFFAKLIDKLRRIFGLKKTSEYTKIIAAIISLGETNLEEENKIFSKETLADELETDNISPDKLVANSLAKMEASIEQTIKNLTDQMKFAEEARHKGLQKHINTFNSLKKEIKKFADTNMIKGIDLFADTMIGNLKYVINKLNKVDNNDKDYLANAIRVYKQVASAYSIVGYLQDMIIKLKHDPNQEVATLAEIDMVANKLKVAKGEYEDVSKTLHLQTQKYMGHFLNDIKYWRNVEYNFREKYRKEYRDNNITGIARDTWVAKKMGSKDAQKEIQAAIKKESDKLIYNPSWDIISQDVLFSHSINLSNKLIQIMGQMLTTINSRRRQAIKEQDIKMLEQFSKLTAEKNSTNINSIYKGMTESDSDGNIYFKGEYSIDFYNKVVKKIIKLRKDYNNKQDKITEEMAKYAYRSPEYMKLSNKLLAVKVSSTAAIKALEDANMILLDNGKRIPMDKWKTDLSSLSPEAKKTLKLFVEMTKDIHKRTKAQGISSNIMFQYGAQFYKIPAVTKTLAERALTGKWGGLYKAGKQDLAGYSPDDVGELAAGQDMEHATDTRKVFTDLAGNRTNHIRIWNRGKLDKTRQSMDFMTVMRIDYINAITYEERKKSEQDLNFLVDIAREGQIYEKEGTQKILNDSGMYNIKAAVDSNLVKKLNSMLEGQFYDSMNKSNIKYGKADLNKVSNYINNASAFLTLSLNLASGAANVLNAGAQLFMESIIKGHFIKTKGIAKANKIYTAGMLDIVTDLYSPIDVGYVNQFSQYFNVRGMRNLGKTNFMQTSLAKKGLDLHSLQIFQTSGEHYIQAITSMAVADGVKVMDANHNYINKDGKIVSSIEQAASVLDMLIIQNNGIMEMNDKVVYTTHSTLTAWEEGGKEHVEDLITKKIYDTVGAYKQMDQPEAFRHALWRMALLYRKYFVPMGIARFRNIGNSLKKYDDMRDEDYRFSYALMENEEGTYTTLIQFIRNGLFTGKTSIQHMSATWSNLTDYQRNNVRRSVTEMVITFAVLPIAIQLIQSLRGGDDDEWVFFLLYQLRRLETELSQYRSIKESFKMLRSPIPSMRVLGSALDIVGNVFDPTSWDDEVKSGKDKGDNKFLRTLGKMTPGVKEWINTYKDKFEYQNQNWGGGA